jgi:beta-lactamase class A
MLMRSRFSASLGLFLCIPAFPQAALQRQIAAIAADAHGKVSVACSLPGASLNCDLNPQAHPPMQSVFKLPLAVTTLHRVELGKLSLDQPIRFLPSDRILPHAYSPLQDKYPGAEVEIPLRELLRLTVLLSDNTAADVVLRAIGGPGVVVDYLNSIGIGDFQLKDNEAALHRDVAAQYRDWWEPQSAVQLLRRLNDNPPLAPEHAAMLLAWMRDTDRAPNRIKGRLPPGTIVMHKPGTSGTDHGLAYATNDIGLITLPDHRSLAIAIFITDSTADEAARDLVIARIARAAYDAAVGAGSSAVHSEPAEISLQRLRGPVYLVVDPHYASTNSVIYIGPKSVTVIGATYTPQTAGELAARIKRVTMAPITEVIDTSPDPEWSGGNAYWKDIGAKIFALKPTYDLLKNTWADRNRRAQTNHPGYPDLPLVLPTEVFPQHFELQDGNVRAFYLGPSHTPGDIFVYFPREQVLDAGSIVKEHLGNLADANLSEYPKTLERLKMMQLKIKIIVAGHWSAVHGPDLIDRYLSMLQAQQ